MEKTGAFRPLIVTAVILVRLKDKPIEKAQPVGCAFSMGFTNDIRFKLQIFSHDFRCLLENIVHFIEQLEKALHSRQIVFFQFCLTDAIA